MHHFCTYFDGRFVLRALALHRSLCRHVPRFTLHALCFDDEAYDFVAALNDPTFRPIALRELESALPALRQAKVNRNPVEYYFTCTPALPLYLLDQDRDIPAVTYLDADLYFFGDPTPIFAELGTGSVAIISHRYPPHLKHFECYGRFNVGWLTFRNDAPGRACLQRWHEQCLEWCYEQVEETRFADQKYLDAWPRNHAGVVELQHPGANLAPWNIANYTLEHRDGRVHVDGRPLVFFHFHRLKPVRPYLYDPGLKHYGASADATVIRRIYAPYLRELRDLAGLYPRVQSGNPRLAAMHDRGLLRTLIYGHTLLHLGPIATEVHLEPFARPLLWLRERTKRAA